MDCTLSESGYQSGGHTLCWSIRAVSCIGMCWAVAANGGVCFFTGASLSIVSGLFSALVCLFVLFAHTHLQVPINERDCLHLGDSEWLLVASGYVSAVVE